MHGVEYHGNQGLLDAHARGWVADRGRRGCRAGRLCLRIEAVLERVGQGGDQSIAEQVEFLFEHAVLTLGDQCDQDP